VCVRVRLVRAREVASQNIFFFRWMVNVLSEGSEGGCIAGIAQSKS
jgi:hypothetical protein